MIIRRYINGKKVDIEVQTTPPPPAPPVPQVPPIAQQAPTTAPPASIPPRKRGCGCGRK